MTPQQKPITEYTTEELEKLELKLWRAKHETTERLNGIINDLAVVNGVLSERERATEDTE